jgi:spore maturation protein CgeE
MIETLLTMDHDYLKNYCQVKDHGDYLEFYDLALEGMYDHNFISLKNHWTDETLLQFIEEKIDERRQLNKEFLKIELNFDVSTNIFQSLSIQPEITRLDYMMIDTKEYRKLSAREDCTVKVAKTQEILEDGLSVNFKAFAGVDESFIKAMNERKSKVFSDQQSTLNLYVCYFQNKPIGNIEYFTQGKYAKIEDFDIIDNYQRMGFGTTVLKTLLKKSYDQGITSLYLVTDHSDTAKDMYRKCYFEKVGDFTELFFDLKE